MRAVNLYKPFSVEVFTDQKSPSESTWFKIGDYEKLADAVNACKKVIDDCLSNSRYPSLSSDTLTLEYLRYGSIPCIRGVDNLNAFDPYDYLESKARNSAAKMPRH